MTSLVEKLKAGASKSGNGDLRHIGKTRGTESLGEALEKLVDAHLETLGQVRDRPKTGFAPSDTNDCSRRMVYLLNGVPFEKNIEPRVQRIFDNGHSFHERTVQYFKDMGILAAEEYEVWLEYPPMHAYIDAIINLDGPVIVELKSVGDVGFENRLKYGQPKKEHMMQIQYYLHITGVKRGIVYYENKNDQRILCFEVEYDKDLVEKALSKHRKTYQAYIDGTLPKRPARSPESSTCIYCEYKPMCWAGFPDNLAP